MSTLHRCWYFGCWGEVGHFLWTPNRRHVWECPAGEDWRFDGGFAPGITDKASRYSCSQKLGEWRRTLVNGCTVIACWDRSVDSRGASNAAFIVEGEHSLADALAVAKATFPAVATRILRQFTDELNEVAS